MKIHMKKQEYINSVFTNIASVYDLMNVIMTFGLVKRWRNYVVDNCGLRQGDCVLDVCTGTGEMVFLLADAVGPTGEVIGLDICKEMLNIAQKKQVFFRKRGFQQKQISFLEGNALALPFADNTFNCVITTLALRNVSDTSLAIQEMVRVCKKNGKVVCLEISEPQNYLLKLGFRIHFHILIPLLGRAIGKGQRIVSCYPPYTWLSQSLKGFPQGKEMTRIFQDAGLKDTAFHPLGGGIVTVYYGDKI